MNYWDRRFWRGTLLDVALLVVGLVALVVIYLTLTAGALYSCEYDDQLMYSDGTCVDLDAILDSVQDSK